MIECSVLNRTTILTLLLPSLEKISQKRRYNDVRAGEWEGRL